MSFRVRGLGDFAFPSGAIVGHVGTTGGDGGRDQLIGGVDVDGQEVGFGQVGVVSEAKGLGTVAVGEGHWLGFRCVVHAYLLCTPCASFGVRHYRHLAPAVCHFLRGL